MLHQLLDTWFHWVEAWGYGGVVFLMALESSIFPVPSEVVIPPAAFWAVNGRDGAAPTMTLMGVVIAGTIGSYLGSAITYAVSRWVGRPVIARWGKYVIVTPEHLARAARFLGRYEAAGLIFPRLLPVVRHLISIPAGLVRMPFGKFSLMTTIGSALWCAILTWYGKGIAERNPGLIKEPEKLVHAIKHESLWLVAGIAVLCVLYFLMMRLTGEKHPEGRPE